MTHLDSHMGVLAAHWYNTGPPSKLDVVSVYKKLAQEFALPVRMASQELLATRGAAGLREEFARAGIVFPDFLWPVDHSVQTRIARRTGCGRFASCGRVFRSCSSTRRSRRMT